MSALSRLFPKLLGPALPLVAALLAPAMLSTGAQAHEYKAGTIFIGHPWSRATPAGAPVAAGYLTLRNDGTSPDRLVSISSDISAKAEPHEMSMDSAGVMTMRPMANGIELKPGEEVVLKPGAFHIMFTQLKQPPKAGTRFPATLTFEKAGPVTVEFDVEPIGAKPDHAGHSG